jgi:UDP-N-acetylmuramyl pentapeptide phosphotransferase/UDP-N-acetylglucosamine-1-phosphate transferase
MINTYNFMDGTNGHAAIQALITAGAGAAIVAVAGKGVWLLPALYLTVAGAAAGFLPHNFPRARMFMGDAGSIPLGAALGILALWSARDAGPGVLAPLALLQFNFILDMTVTLGRRLWRGKKLCEAHREHLYERFAVAAGSHARAVAVEGGVALLAAGMLIAYPAASGILKGVILAAVVAVWVIYYAAVERFCRLRACGVPAA